MFSWDSLLTLFQLLAVSVNPPPAAHSMRTCPDPSNDKNAVSARRNVLSENNSCSVNWSTRVAPYMLSPNYEKSWQSRLMMKTWAYFGFCVCLRLTHVLPHRLTSKPHAWICNPEKREVLTSCIGWPTFYHDCVVLLVDPPVEGGEGVGDGDGDDGGQQAEPWRPHAGGLVGCARKTGRFRAGHRWLVRSQFPGAPAVSPLGLWDSGPRLTDPSFFLGCPIIIKRTSGSKAPFSLFLGAAAWPDMSRPDLFWTSINYECLSLFVGSHVSQASTSWSLTLMGRSERLRALLGSVRISRFYLTALSCLINTLKRGFQKDVYRYCINLLLVYCEL